ncbi:MAG TPA: 16S rRNA (cytosine(1402)-N(4))-methyltransferase RsmH [candidate division Zixibacteria bacterium]|nr:16S rRNA (cytosine(1402)-N(4))-methyltransferase RsmH [candidate division Zixibacteria bacterium]
MKRKPSEFSHLPVMADEVVSFLVTKKDGAYVDLTAGLGGHLLALAQALDKGARLYGIDKDQSALEVAERKLKDVKPRLELVKGSYGDLVDIAENFNDKKFDGALLDLGLSSLQLDDVERGFKYSDDGPLDMRFDQSAQIPTAADLVNKLNEKGLYEIIRDYGEEKRARQIAGAIVKERQRGMILTSSHLAKVVNTIARPPHQNKSLARVFQALRIAVNKELETLKSALPQIIELLNKGGRIAVISYHSLEDRIVKYTFRDLARTCICPPGLPQCVCNANPQLKPVTKKPVTPSSKEINSNPRSRSALLRVAEKIA